MTTRDTPTACGAVSRLNHWIGELFVILLPGIGLRFSDMPRGAKKTFWRGGRSARSALN